MLARMEQASATPPKTPVMIRIVWLKFIATSEIVPAVPATTPGRYKRPQKYFGCMPITPEVRERASFMAAIASNCLWLFQSARQDIAF